VNYYQQKDTLMGHVDRSEVCATAPLVSISYAPSIFHGSSAHQANRLGLSAIFLIGGTDRNTKPYALVLRSGDVMIMAGPRCRRAYHGVPRILEGSLPAHLASREGDWEPYAKYLNSARINVNVRQVFPKDFDPSVYARP
jgi:alkylated DNA repair protein alkB family protein 1